MDSHYHMQVPSREEPDQEPAESEPQAHQHPSQAQTTNNKPSPTHPPPAFPLYPSTSTLPYRNELPSATKPLHHENSNVLPPLTSATVAQLPPISTMMSQSPPPWSGFTSHQLPPPPGAQYQTTDSPTTVDFESSSTGTMSVASPDLRLDRRSASVTLDDLDVRMAAEALGDLKTNFVNSPPNVNAPLPMSPPAPGHTRQFATSSRSLSPNEPEPLLSLLTTAHPFLATTTGYASSAYGGAKNFSPRFKSGAEYVEGYLTPLANTVGSVGGLPGVDRSVRWFLGAGRRQRSDVETGSKKRRKVQDDSELSNKRRGSEDLRGLPMSDAGNISESSTPRDSRRMSFASTVSTLPGYTDEASDEYSKTDSQAADSQAGDSQDQSPHENAPWTSRLMISTSGLTCAMNDDSLRRLKWTLEMARRANQTLGGVPDKIKNILEQFEEPESESADNQASEKDQSETTVEDTDGEKTPDQTREEVAIRINTIRDEIARTLGSTINNVSRYAAGALPDNARNLVYRHLVSLPQRFAFAARAENNEPPSAPASTNPDSAVREKARQVLVLAKEGLDMVSQVSGVIDATIVSAEEWCERMGKKGQQGEGEDVHMA